MRITLHSVLILLLALRAHASGQEALPRYETKYYILYTDVPPEQANEVALRMSKMAEEYHARTRDFSGEIHSKFPFYLYQHRDDYLAAGGMAGTDGLFNGTALFAVVGERLNDRTWHVIQHEGFHQFAFNVIGGQRPMWIDEGLAEYFGEALFTGDGFVSGIVPSWRVKRLRDEIQNDKLLPFDKMMSLSRDEWNSKITIENYDQAWSMVHFLAHGENGRYQHAFASMMIELSRGQQPQKCWADNFGTGQGFEQRWKTYWLNLPEDAGAEQRAQVTVARLSSFLARAAAQKQAFKSFEEFQSAAKSRQLRIAPDQWLPDSLLVDALADSDDMIKAGAEFTLVSKSPPQIQCTLHNGTHLIGTFVLQRGQVVRVDVRIEPSKSNREVAKSAKTDAKEK